MQIVHEEEARPSWLDHPILARITLNWETILFATILIIAVFSRLYAVGERVISHDENTHVVFSWQLYKGLGYAHDPLSHGPFQFHLVALTYFLFGDTDFTARLSHALMNIVAIAFLWNFRRYFGRIGALIAAGMFLISPYILYYARYARNETFITLFGVVMLWAILRYLETGASRYLYWLTAATVLHFCSKETAFIYTAQALLFLGLYLIYRLTQREWPHPSSRNLFLISLILALLLIGGSGAAVSINRSGTLTATETVAPAVPGQVTPPAAPATPSALAITLGILGIIALAAAAYFLIRGLTLELLRTERSFDLLILLGTLVLPMLAPLPLKGLGWTVPHNAAMVNSMTTIDMVRMGAVLISLALVSVAVGLWWNPRLWLGNAALFYSIFTVLYTTVFTNGAGFFTGLLGSLGYWLEQQGVQRGSQPWYYYALVQVPVYEYLPALGGLLALVYSLRWWLRKPKAEEPEPEFERPTDDPSINEFTGQIPNSRLVVALLGFWSVTSLIAYTIAGEKMPWLTVHITLPLILLAAWAFGRLVESVDWSAFRASRGLLVVILLPVFLVSFTMFLGSLLGPNPPFQGKELAQLQNTSTFITSFLGALFSGWALVSLTKSWPQAQLGRVLLLAVFAFLALLTARTAITASYISFDNANELLVYAHGAPGQKQALEQIEEISRRTTGGLNINVAYDNETNYSYWWYLRNYPNKVYYGTEPTRALRDSPVIVVGDTNFQKIEPVVGQAYYQFDYIRLWWPNQDYYDLTWDRILFALKDPEMRSALFQIWLNRDYTEYGKATQKDMSLANWYPSARMRLYIRKDVAAQLWDYGVGPQAAVADPYESKKINISADRIIGTQGSEPGQFNRPRDLTVAPDGSIYVADTDNHRIQHLDANGNVINTWGSFADLSKGAAPGSTFFEPWGIALGPDGSVYVADTWNHRIQKFSADGEFITMWGYFGQAERPDGFWGPRDVAVDAQGQVYVTDTGNKRIAVFDADGIPITQFGEVGLAAGQFDEPVGIAVGPDSQVYVADTWNQRIQTFIRGSDGTFAPLSSWDVAGWYGQSLDNKPFLTIDNQGRVFVTDPENSRVLEFSNQGEFIQYWGDYSTGPDGFGLAGSVATDPQGGVWVSDAGNGRIMHFTIP